MIAEDSSAYKLIQSIAVDLHKALKTQTPELRESTLKAWHQLVSAEIHTHKDGTIAARRALGEHTFDAAYAPLIFGDGRPQSAHNLAVFNLLRKATGFAQILKDIVDAREDHYVGLKTFANDADTLKKSDSSIIGEITRSAGTLLSDFSELYPHFRTGTTWLALQFAVASIAAWQDKYDPNPAWNY